MTLLFSRSAPRVLALASGAVVLGIALAAQKPPDIGIAPVKLAAGPFTVDTAEQHLLRVVVVARGLNHPFSLAFLPNGDALLTERGAGLRVVRGATGPSPVLDPTPVPGTPETRKFRTGGLHEVAVHPDFANNRFVYFTYNKPGAETDDPARPMSAIALARGRFDGSAITDLKEVFVGGWQKGASGSRLAFGRDGLLYMTTGAPNDDQAQDLSTVYGKVLRLRDDGSVPADNPFVGQTGKRAEIYSYGHRDHIGLAIQPATGAVLNAEHGPNGGDEINLILAGHNYGWPKYTWGRNYDGKRLSESPVAPGIDAPLVVWIPSIAPSGLAIYAVSRFPAWKNNLFVGSSRRGEVPRTGGLERVVLNDTLEEQRRETLLTDLHQRIRDVRQGPDELLYVITDEDDGALLRLEPAPAAGTRTQQ